MPFLRRLLDGPQEMRVWGIQGVMHVQMIQQFSDVDNPMRHEFSAVILRSEATKDPDGMRSFALVKLKCSG